jgi:hypothetical protein
LPGLVLVYPKVIYLIDLFEELDPTTFEPPGVEVAMVAIRRCGT